MSSEQIGLFATGLWQDLGSPNDLSANTISGWVSQPSTVGKLNNLIGTCYSGIGYTGVGSWNNDVKPDLTDSEFGILDQMYRVSYYQQLVRNIAGGGGSNKIVQQMSEGDSKVTFVSAADLARVYTENLKEAQSALKYQVNVYIQNSAGGNMPSSVDFYTVLPQQYNNLGRRGGELFS